MSVELAKEIWDELKRHVNVVDRDEAAETLVSVLIDNDVDAGDIKSTFKTDSAVKAALASYLKDHAEEEEDDWTTTKRTKKRTRTMLDRYGETQEMWYSRVTSDISLLPDFIAIMKVNWNTQNVNAG
jgi:hypothetical protein